MGRKRSNAIVIKKKGEPCPRCGKATELRKHRAVTEKMLRQPFYYSQWFKCTNKKCKTSLIMLERFKVWNTSEEEDKPLDAIKDQFQDSDRLIDQQVIAR